MSRLLRADFYRLWKSRALWVCMVILCAVVVYISYEEYSSMQQISDYHTYLGDVLFEMVPLIHIAFAVFIAVFIGTEYSDGGIRNRLISGHSRVSVYCSNLIVTVAATCAMYFCVSFLLIGTCRLLGIKSSVPITVLVVTFLCQVVTNIAFVSLAVMICMTFSGRAAGAVVTLVVAFGIMLAAVEIPLRLNAYSYDGVSVYYADEEDDDIVYYINEEDEIEIISKEDIPPFLTGKRRERYEFLYDFLPACQSMQYVRMQEIPGDMAKFPLYSASIILVVSVCGVFIFCRKSVK